MARFNGLPLPQAAEGRTSRFAGIPVDNQEPQAAPQGRTWGDFAKDSALSVGQGFANLGADLSWLVDTATPGDLSAVTRRAERSAQWYADNKSTPLKGVYDQLGAADGFVETLKVVKDSPEVVPDILLGSIAYLLPMGAAGRAAKGVRAATAAVAGTGGALEGAGAARQAEQQVQEMTFGDLLERSSEYRNQIEQGKTPEQAKESVRKATGLTAFAVTAPIAALASVITGAAKLESKFFKGDGAGGFFTGLAKESVEEAIQEGSNQFGANVGQRAFADDTQKLGEGVASSAALGVVAGSGQSGAIGAIQLANRFRPRRENPDETINRIAEAETVEDAVADLNNAVDFELRTVQPGETIPVEPAGFERQAEQSRLEDDLTAALKRQDEAKASGSVAAWRQATIEANAARSALEAFRGIEFADTIPTLTETVTGQAERVQPQAMPGAEIPGIDVLTPEQQAEARRRVVDFVPPNMTTSRLEPAQQATPGAGIPSVDLQRTPTMTLEPMGVESPAVEGAPAAIPQPTILLNSSGQPFRTKKSASLSVTFRNNPDAEIVPVEGGFGIKPVPKVLELVPREGEQVAQQAAAVSVQPDDAIPAAGAEAVAQRQINAVDSFRAAAMEQFGVTQEQATSAWNALLKEKLVSIDPVGGQFNLKTGAVWDRDVILRAAGVDTDAAPQAQPAPVAATQEAQPGPAAQPTQPARTPISEVAQRTADIQALVTGSKSLAEARTAVTGQFGEAITKAQEQVIKEAWNQKQARIRRQIRDDDSLATAIAKLGGIGLTYKQDITGDTKGNKMDPGVGPVFRETGTSPDDMASKLQEWGYLSQSEMDSRFDNGGVNLMSELLRSELSGGRKRYQLTSNKAMEDLLREQQEDAEAQAAAAESLREQEYAQIAAEYGQDVADQARAYDEGIQSADESVDAQLAQEREDERQRINEAAALDAGQAARDDDLRQGDDEGGGDQAEAVGADEAEQGFQLGQQTPEDIRAQENARKASEQAARDAETKRQADSEAGAFTLAGSNSPVDQAEARGQLNAFDAPAAKKEEQVDAFGLTADDAAGVDTQLEQLRTQLVDLENRIVGMAGLAPGFVEDAMRSRKVPAALKDQAKEIRAKMRDLRAQKVEIEKSAAPAPAAAPRKKPVTPQVLTNSSFNSIIQIAADSIDKLRAVDVERVLEETPIVYRADMAMRIKRERPDLAAEVDEVAAEMDMGRVQDGARGQRNLMDADPAEQSTPDRLAAILQEIQQLDVVVRSAASTDQEFAQASKRLKELRATIAAEFPDAQADFDRMKAGEQRWDLAAKPASRIEDFGERIQGAKKDMWAQYREKMAASKDADIAAVPLSQSWPEPDYQKMLDAGADPWAVAFAHASRDEVPAKPKVGYKVKRWVSQVEQLRSMAYDLIEGRMSVAETKAALNKTSGLSEWAGRIDLYMAAGHDKSLKGISLKSSLYSVFNSVNYSPAKKIWSVEQKPAATAFSSWPKMMAFGDTKEEAIASFVARLGQIDTKPDAKQVQFEIYSRRGEDGYIIGKKLGRNHIDLARADSIKAAREYIRDNQAELESRLEKAKGIPFERRDSNDPRVGVDMRNGQDVTPQMFSEAFGFRGVQFGNWVELNRRQQDLNNAYDALMDMAAILGIPPKAISLNGELGLAFGARGSGGKTPAAAHYEAGQMVINLTKKNGAGSLGHEWWHALDNYFSRMRGQKDGFMTDASDVTLASKGAKYLVRGEVRKEMVDAFGAVMKSIRNTALRARSAKLDSRRSKDYWTTDIEMSARAFESYLISRLQDQNASNDYLANIVDEDVWKAASALGFELDDSYPYPTAGEIPAIRAGFDEFFDTIKTRETDTGVALFSRLKGSGKGTTKAAIESAIAPALSKFRDEVGMAVEVVQSASELPDSILNYAGDDLTFKGAYLRGKVYLVADNISNARDAQVTLAHELVGHMGVLEAITPEEWASIKTDIASLLKFKSKAAAEIMAEVDRRYPGADEVTRYKEFIAVAAERREKSSAVARVLSKVREAIRRFLKSMGLRGPFAESDIDIILSNSEAYLKTGYRPGMATSDELASQSDREFYSDIVLSWLARNEYGDAILSDTSVRLFKLAGATGEAAGRHYPTREAAQRAAAPGQEVEAVTADPVTLTPAGRILVLRGSAAQSLLSAGEMNTLEMPDLSDEGLERSRRAAAIRADTGYATLRAGNADGEIYDVSPAGIGQTIEVDGIQRPTTNSNGQPIAQTDEALRNFWRWFGDSAVVDAEGRPLVVYHGTDRDFDEFDRTVWVSEDPEHAGEFAAGGRKKMGAPAKRGSNLRQLYVDLRNPLDLSDLQTDSKVSAVDVLARAGVTPTDEEWQQTAQARIDSGALITRESAAEVAARDYLTPRALHSVLSDSGVLQRLQAAGYDGLSVTERFTAGKGKAKQERTALAHAVFDPKRVVSATAGRQLPDTIGNAGTFDPNDPSILFSRVEQSDFQQENSRIREEDQTLWNKVKTEARRQLSPGGLLPDSVFKAKIARDSKLAVVEFDAAHLIGELERAIRKDYGVQASQLSQADQDALSQALGGRIPASVTGATKEALVAMRQYIDKQSREYAQVLREQIASMAGQLDEGEQRLLQAFLDVSKIDNSDGTPPQKAAATRQRNAIIEAAREDAKAIWGDGKQMQESLGRVATLAEKISLTETITANEGKYVHRSYKAFDDPNWYKKVPDKVLDDARNYLMQRMMDNGDVTKEEALTRARVLIEDILKEGTAYDNMEAFIRESKLGAKDLSVLKKRKQIAPEIRALLGEHKDPRVNFAKSVTKMGRLIWNQRFLDRVREVGLGEFLFTEENRPPNTTKIAADGSEVYAPLNGLYAPREIVQAFKDALGKEQMANWYRTVVQINGAVKFGKTVLSPTTAMRNWQSAMFFTLANGHFDWKHMGKSIAGVREYFNQAGDDEKIAYLRKLKDLGVVYDTPYAGEMMRLLDDSEMERFMSGSDAALGVRKALNFAQKFYQYGDDFWKIIGFENEKAMLMEYAGMSQQQAEVEAAERIRNTYPTYSMIGKGIQSLRRFPLAGTFVSFPAEIIRTSFHMLRYLKQDYQNERTRPMALKRAAGLAIASGFAAALQAMSKAMFDIDDDDEEAIRLQAAPWQQNSNLVFTGRDEAGRLQYFDISFLDPYNYWKRPINAIMRDQPWEDEAVSAASEMLAPFFGTDILAGAIFEILANKKDSGGEVFKETDSPVNQLADIAAHLGKTVQPGFTSNFFKTVDAMQGEVSPSGQKYNLRDEGMAWLGWRITTLDPKVALYYRSFDFDDAKADASRTLTQVLSDPNQVSDDDIAEAYDAAEKMRAQAYSDMGKMVSAARRSGMTNQQIIATLRGASVSQRDIASLLNDRIPPWAPTKQSETMAVRRAIAILGPEKANEIRLRYQQARREAMEQVSQESQ